MAGTLYVPQWAHLTSMRAAGLDVGVWRPCCLLSGRISAELAAIAGVDPADEYAVPGARPAVSGVPLVVDAPQPARPPRPRRQPVLEELPRPAPTVAVALQELLAGEPTATGYVIEGGRIGAQAAETIGAVRMWLRVHGIPMSSYRFPLRLVVDV